VLIGYRLIVKGADIAMEGNDRGKCNI